MIKRKALNYDLDDNLLKQYYPNSSYKNAYRDIKKFFLSHGFEERQYSGVVSKKGIPQEEILLLVKECQIKYPWFQKCIKKFDMTTFEKGSSLLEHIQMLSSETSEELIDDLEEDQGFGL